MANLPNGLSEMLEDLLYSHSLPLYLAYILGWSFSVPKILSDRLLKLPRRFLIGIRYEGGNTCETIIDFIHIENGSCLGQQLQLVLRIQIPAPTVIIPNSIGQLVHVDADGSFSRYL